MAWGVGAWGAGLVQESAAAPGPAVAVQLALVILDGELVVVGQLFSAVDLPQGKDDDVLAAVHVDDARVAVGLARVVDEAGGVALHRRVHHVKVVNAEHVATDSLKQRQTFHHRRLRYTSAQQADSRCEAFWAITDFAVVEFLPLIGQDGANDRAGILDHHLSGLDVPFAEKSTAMNIGPKQGGKMGFEKTK